MKRKILMAGTAMLLSLAAIAGDSTKVKSCCKGSIYVKTCSKKCVCNSKKCAPETCKSKTCECHK